MILLDIILAILIVLAFLYGLWGGFIKRASEVIGLIAGIWIATLYYQLLASALTTVISINDPLAQGISFMLLLAGMSSAISFLANKIFSLVRIIPFASLVDRLLGAIITAFLAIIIIGALLTTTKEVPFIGGKIEDSFIAKTILSITDVVLPNALDAMQFIKTKTS